MVSMHAVDYFIQLQSWLFMFYFFTAGIGSAVLGYCLGRWVPVYIRLIPWLVILPMCAYWGRDSCPLLELCILGNLTYAYFCRRGLKRKAEDRGIAFEDLPHFDWIIVVAATILMFLLSAP